MTPTVGWHGEQHPKQSEVVLKSMPSKDSSVKVWRRTGDEGKRMIEIVWGNADLEGSLAGRAMPVPSSKSDHSYRNHWKENAPRGYSARCRKYPYNYLQPKSSRKASACALAPKKGGEIKLEGQYFGPLKKTFDLQVQRTGSKALYSTWSITHQARRPTYVASPDRRQSSPLYKPPPILCHLAHRFSHLQ